MKYNRKKRPKVNPKSFLKNPPTLMEQSYKAYVIAVNEFEEGFEAELRKKLVEAQKHEKVASSAEWEGIWHGRAETIKEILANEMHRL